MADTGVVKSVSRIEDEDGKTVVQAIVHFYDGDAPEINLGTIWHRRPVKIIDASIHIQDREKS